ncbi:MAG: SelB C-terminal domain-containing protein [Pyrinomonadaceae bacterium]
MTLSDADAELQHMLEETYRAARLEAPTTEEALARATKSANRPTAAVDQARKIMQLLINAGTLVHVGDFYFHRGALEDLTARLREYAARRHADRTIDVAAFKELSGVSRKYAIPLLEHLDRTRVTRRAGDRRIIL